MDNVAISSAQDRRELFVQTALSNGMHPMMVEKDFWVCWTLSKLFTYSFLQGHLIFKGGTSLSKVFDVIKRFSEDIDITIGRELLGFSADKNPDKIENRKKRESVIDEMTEIAASKVQGSVLDGLKKEFNEVISDMEWSLIPDETAKDGLTLLFYYPVATEKLDYVSPFVKIEFGVRSDTWPCENRVIRPYSAESFPKVFKNAETLVRVLSAKRTFWEKATILHQEANRQKDSPTPVRYSRHYYDLAMLSTTKFCAEALVDTHLLQRVIEHKKMFFRCGWAQYENAMPDTIKLLPPEYRFASLRDDYSRMQEMIFGTKRSFEEILDILKNLEERMRKKSK